MFGNGVSALNQRKSINVQKKTSSVIINSNHNRLKLEKGIQLIKYSLAGK